MPPKHRHQWKELLSVTGQARHNYVWQGCLKCSLKRVDTVEKGSGKRVGRRWVRGRS